METYQIPLIEDDLYTARTPRFQPDIRAITVSNEGTGLEIKNQITSKTYHLLVADDSKEENDHFPYAACRPDRSRTPRDAPESGQLRPGHERAYPADFEDVWYDSNLL